MKQIHTYKCLILFISLFLFSCNNKKSLEDIFIEEKFPKILNLNSSDINDFKESLEFDENNKVISYDYILLKKAYPSDEEYEYAFFKINRETEPLTTEIIAVDSLSNETIYRLSFNDINDNKFLFDDIDNAVVYVTSTNCSQCVKSFEMMNEISNKFADKKIKFIAFFHKIKNIENYKKGSIYQKLGFLNDNWKVLQSKQTIEFLTEKYSDSLAVPYVFFIKNKKDLNIYPDNNLEEISKIIETNY